MTILVSLIFASFLHCHAHRQQSNQISHHSICCHCQKPLQLYDLIPLFSYLFLRGQSRCCQQKIPIHYLLAELMGLGVGFLWSTFPVSVLEIALSWSLFYNFWLDLYTYHLHFSLFVLCWVHAFHFPSFSIIHILVILSLVIASLLNKLGWGDTFVLSALLVRYDLFLFNLALFFSSFLALLSYPWLKKDQGMVPFGPFICTIYFILLYIVP